MPQLHRYSSQPQITACLKRANGHLGKAIVMPERQAPCTDITRQPFMVEKAITTVKRALTHDPIGHCLASGAGLVGVEDVTPKTKFR